MSKFWAFIDGWKRVSIAGLAIMAQIGGFIPPEHQEKAVIVVSVLTAGTKLVDWLKAHK